MELLLLAVAVVPTLWAASHGVRHRSQRWVLLIAVIVPVSTIFCFARATSAFHRAYDKAASAAALDPTLHRAEWIASGNRTLGVGFAIVGLALVALALTRFRRRAASR